MPRGADKYIMVGERALPDGWVLPGYEHIQELGAGAGGYVWLARHQVTGTPVAVKYLVPGLHASSDFREAYRAEAQLLAELDSPHVTRLYEYVEGPPGAAIVMEAVDGASLRALLKQEGAAVTPEAALCILKGSLLGLAAAHDSGVVHRDFKPANVLVTPEGVSKLVDFGIAARTGSAAPAAGTPLYMAPEQFHGVPASPASDVYAATVTFFECVTGERPFPGANAVELMAQHALGTIPDDLAPPPVRALIRKGMAKEPDERPASAREFVTRLEAVAGAAYGPDWEERGQHKLATLLALLPLLLIRGASQAAPASTTSVATTVLGEEPLTVTIAPSESAQEPHQGRRHHHRHSLKASLGAVIAGLVAMIIVAAAAAYGAYKPAHPHTDSAAFASATTEVTPGTAAALTQAPTPSASASPTVSPTSTTSASATSTESATATPTTPSATATATTSATASTPPPTPVINSLTITQLSCGPSYTLDAEVEVTSNSQGGTLTLNWFYETVTGAQEPVGTTMYTVPAGSSDQTVSPPGEDFSQYTDFNTWGVTVSSTPTASSGTNPTQTVDAATTTGCYPPIQ